MDNPKKCMWKSLRVPYICANLAALLKIGFLGDVFLNNYFSKLIRMFGSDNSSIKLFVFSPSNSL